MLGLGFNSVQGMDKIGMGPFQGSNLVPFLGGSRQQRATHQRESVCVLSPQINLLQVCAARRARFALRGFQRLLLLAEWMA